MKLGSQEVERLESWEVEMVPIAATLMPQPSIPFNPGWRTDAIAEPRFSFYAIPHALCSIAISRIQYPVSNIHYSFLL